MRKSVFMFAALAGIALLAPGISASAEQAAAPKRVISLIGDGEVFAEPDMALVTIGVVREAKTAGAALKANSQAMNAVMETITGTGVASKDVQTSAFSVSPKYHYPKRSSNGEQQAPRITGYTVSNTISVAVRKLDSLGEILDSVVSAGSNQINGVSFAISKPEPLRNRARKLATRDAIEKAGLYAEAAGVKLGNILSIREQSHTIAPPRPMPRVRAMAMEAGASVPVARGEHKINMQVHISWQIK